LVDICDVHKLQGIPITGRNGGKVDGDRALGRVDVIGDCEGVVELCFNEFDGEDWVAGVGCVGYGERTLGGCVGGRGNLEGV
jgi:hypothetical protein